MERWQPLYIRSQNILILIDFVRVMRMISDSSGKCKFPDAILTLFVILFLRLSSISLRISLWCILKRTSYAWWIVWLGMLLSHDYLLCVSGLSSGNFLGTLISIRRLSCRFRPCNRRIAIAALVWWWWSCQGRLILIYICKLWFNLRPITSLSCVCCLKSWSFYFILGILLYCLSLLTFFVNALDLGWHISIV